MHYHSFFPHSILLHIQFLLPNRMPAEGNDPFRMTTRVHCSPCLQCLDVHVCDDEHKQGMGSLIYQMMASVSSSFCGMIVWSSKQICPKIIVLLCSLCVFNIDSAGQPCADQPQLLLFTMDSCSLVFSCLQTTHLLHSALSELAGTGSLLSVLQHA